MRVLVACEFSGVVRDAFIRRGHQAISCDVRDTTSPGPHIKSSVQSVIDDGWDMMLAFPPCTYLCASGARWHYDTPKMYDSLAFVRLLLDAQIEKIALENPVGAISTHIRQPTQYIQPWQHGHGETKQTGLWLKNLPKLLPTNIVNGRDNRIHRMPQTANRGMLRSITYQGIADAMAQQWG